MWGQEGNGCGHETATGGLLADGNVLYLDCVNVSTLVKGTSARCRHCGKPRAREGSLCITFHNCTGIYSSHRTKSLMKTTKKACHDVYSGIRGDLEAEAASRPSFGFQHFLQTCRNVPSMNQFSGPSTKYCLGSAGFLKSRDIVPC